MDGQPEFLRMAMDRAREGWSLLGGWLPGPAAWSQVALLVRDLLRDRFLRILGRLILMPVMLLYLFDLLGLADKRLAAVSVDLGNIGFSALALLSGAVAATLLFRLGRWPNTRSEDFIRRRRELHPATRASNAEEVEMPYPQRVVPHRGVVPAA